MIKFAVRRSPPPRYMDIDATFNKKRLPNLGHEEEKAGRHAAAFQPGSTSGCSKPAWWRETMMPPIRLAYDRLPVQWLAGKALGEACSVMVDLQENDKSSVLELLWYLRIQVVRQSRGIPMLHKI